MKHLLMFSLSFINYLGCSSARLEYLKKRKIILAVRLVKNLKICEMCARFLKETENKLTTLKINYCIRFTWSEQ